MTEPETNLSIRATADRSPLDVALWSTQALLAALFVGTGLWKFFTPTANLAAAMPWMGQVSTLFLGTTAVLDLLVGIGVLLPSLTRLRPELAVVAAWGCVGLMAGAVVFHLQRGEAEDTPFNVVLAALAGFVAWGRRRVPIPARSVAASPTEPTPDPPRAA